MSRRVPLWYYRGVRRALDMNRLRWRNHGPKPHPPIKANRTRVHRRRK